MKINSLILIFLFGSSCLYSQNAMGNMPEKLPANNDKETILTTGTFKSTRIMNGHSIERMDPGELDFRISHRFGTLNSGAYEFFGLDQANIHLGLEYGITKWLMAGIGRGAYEKTFDGFTKFTLFRQSSGEKSFPLSVSLFSSVAYRTVKPAESEEDYTFSERMSYVGQILAARKINQNFSLQVMPTVIYRNVAGTEPNLLWAAGIGGRAKLSGKISLNAEYYYCFNPGTYNNSTVYNPLSIGIDIEAGGHVFQLVFTNSVAMIEKGFIGETTGRWSKGDIHFGFNISRVFYLTNK